MLAWCSLAGLWPATASQAAHQRHSLHQQMLQRWTLFDSPQIPFLWTGPCVCTGPAHAVHAAATLHLKPVLQKSNGRDHKNHI